MNVYEIQGKYNKAKVSATYLEDSAFAQIQELCNKEHFSDSKICIMPDAHAGKGCTIGTSMTIHGVLEPNLVGVDIGCGMDTTVFKTNQPVDLGLLDQIIRTKVPSGAKIHNEPIETFGRYDFVAPVDESRTEASIGTLGGGNHFIELSLTDSGNYVLTIHSGSRSLGVMVCSYHQGVADSGKGYLEGQAYEDYLHDMHLAQGYADLNRETMRRLILSALEKHQNIEVQESFSTVHNFIETDNTVPVLRKGAIPAYLNQKCLIPLNMRDGCLICVGKGNQEWNWTAPHGAGRVLSRGKAKKTLSLDDFQNDMEGIFTTCVSESTLDECPRAYKPKEQIIENITEMVDVVEVIKPVYNFKA